MRYFLPFSALVCFVSVISLLVPMKQDAPKRSLASLAPGVPWNGGKNRGAFEVYSPQAKVALPSDKESIVDVRLSVSMNCANLKTRVRGLEGVQILSSAWATHAECQMGGIVSHPVSVRLPAGTQGFLAVDVSYEVQGQSFQETRSLSLRDVVAEETQNQQVVINQKFIQEESNGEILHVYPAKSSSGRTVNDSGDL